MAAVASGADFRDLDGPIDRHDLDKFASMVSPRVVPAVQASAGGGNSTNEVLEHRMEQVKQDANRYIEQHNLRQVLQDMFQSVVKERPPDPFAFMRAYMRGGESPDPKATADQVAHLEELQVKIRQQQEEIGELKTRAETASAAAAAARSEKRSMMEEGQKQSEDWEKQYKEALARQQDTIDRLQRRVVELETEAGENEQAKELQKQLEQEKVRNEVLERRVSMLESSNTLGEAKLSAESTAAPESFALAPTTRSSNQLESFSRTGATPVDAMRAMQVPQQHLYTSLVMASTYAPPVPPMTYAEIREDDQVPLAGSSNPEVLVELVGCKDEQTNGLFAWVGVCNQRPIYRLLAPEPRYLYYADVGIASGWRVVDRMGSESCLERFRKPIDAWLPIHCEQGDLNASVGETKLTMQVIQKVSLIGSPEEKLAIRSKLQEAYGSIVTKLETLSEGLVSKSSPVVGIAHALEAQQRMIQLLHSKLANERKRREAAEGQSKSMEEAFETLVLRIQAQMPSPPTAVALMEYQASVQAEMGGPRDEAVAVPVRQEVAAEQEQSEAKRQLATRLAPAPMPHPPVSPKEVKPGAAPTFRRAPQKFRSKSDLEQEAPEQLQGTGEPARAQVEPA